MSEPEPEPTVEMSTTPCIPQEESRLRKIEGHFVKTTDALVHEALENRCLDVLIDVLTFELARLAVILESPQATADILKRFGAHMDEIAARRMALAEAAAAKKRGIAPH